MSHSSSGFKFLFDLVKPHIRVVVDDLCTNHHVQDELNDSTEFELEGLVLGRDRGTL